MTIARQIAAPTGPVLGGGLPWESSSGGSPPAPINTVAPAITGSLYAGATLTCSTGTWTLATSYAYQWERDGTPIGGETAATHVSVLADEGTSITCVVTATGPGGSTAAESAGVTILVFPLTSLIGRYELDLCTLSGANVTALTDRSAQANDLTIGGAGAEVTLEADADYGGRLVGVFAAGKTLTRATFVGGAIAQPTTILWLGEFATLPAASYAYDGPTTRQGFYQASGGGFVFAGASMGAGTLSTATVYPMLTIHNGVSSDHYRGSSWAAPAFTGNPGANAMNGIRLGARDSGAAQMTGRIAIAAVWAKALDATERGQVAAYLNAKYGQAITT